MRNQTCSTYLFILFNVVCVENYGVHSHSDFQSNDFGFAINFEPVSESRSVDPGRDETHDLNGQIQLDSLTWPSLCFSRQALHRGITMAQDKRHLVTLGMFIIDEFSYLNEDGTPTGKASSSQVSSSCNRFVTLLYLATDIQKQCACIDRWRGDVCQYRSSYMVRFSLHE